MNLLSPTNQRPVTYDCPACGGVHTTNVPVMWKGVKQIWLVPPCGAAVRVAVDCSVKVAAGFRHCVRLVAANRWDCVDCRQTFDTWPSDNEECLGGVA